MARTDGVPQRAVTVARGAPLVRVEQLSRVIQTRAQRTVILDDVTFTVPAESLFAINGPSGSGKTSLLNMLTALERPTATHALFGGVALRAKHEIAQSRR